MNKETNKVETETTMKEFVTKSGNRDIKKKAVQAKRTYARKSTKSELTELLKNKQLISLVIYALLAAAVILVSVLIFEIPIVPVCVIAVIETLLAACLHNLPLWLHGTVIAIQIISGAMLGKMVFIVLMALLYIFAIIALWFIITDK